MRHAALKNSLGALVRPAIPPGVQEFAAAIGAGPYLNAVIELARQAFPSSTLCVSLGQDAEDESYRYIALDFEVRGLTAEELLAAQQIWSAGLPHVFPSFHAVCFVLGWR